MKPRSVLLLVPFLVVACAATTTTVSAPALTTKTTVSAPSASASAVATTKPATPRSPSDPGASCTGPYQRGAARGLVACPNASGGWSQLACLGCALQGGACRHPRIDVNIHPPACHPNERCMRPQIVPAGACTPACCDTTLQPLPPDVEDRMTIF